MYLKIKKEIFWGAFLCIFIIENKKKVCFWASNRDILSFGMVKKSFLFFTMDTISCRAAWVICTRFMFLTCLMPWIKKNVFPSSNVLRHNVVIILREHTHISVWRTQLPREIASFLNLVLMKKLSSLCMNQRCFL